MTEHSHAGHLHARAEAPADAEWRRVADRVRNWGRWGLDDELGTLNHITPAAVKYAASLARNGRVISLGVPFNAHGPQGAHGLRRNPIHIMTVDGGDRQADELPKEWRGPTEQWMADLFANGPGRFTDDYIIMPLQSCTQWDALSHFYYEGLLYNGYPASSVTSLGATKDAIDPVAKRGQIVGRGVLLDVARHRGVDHLQADEVITPAELDAVVAAQGSEIRDGDIILVRTGWYLEWQAKRDGEAWAWHSPGLSWRCAEWFYDRNTAAVAADNVGVEVMKPEEGIWSLFHMLALRDMGMMLGEIWDLETLGADCAADKVYDFMLVATALPVSGAVGTPVNPIAIK
jgi:kynurenine formamidase